MQKKQIEKPIFILGAAHSGTSFLGKALKQHPSFATWTETNNIWMWGNVFKGDDQLTENDLNQKIKKHIEKKFIRYLQKSGKERICDKTPRNCLRIPFIVSVFPDAKIIHIIRDGRAVIASTKKEYKRPLYWTEVWDKLRKIPIWEWYMFIPAIPLFVKTMMGISLNYWGAKPPGWNEEIDKLSPNAVLAKQWVETMKIATQAGRKIAPDNYLEIRYEDLINSPKKIITEIAEFADIRYPESIIEFCKINIDLTRNPKRLKSLDSNTLGEIKEIIEPTMSELGYLW
ncbi:MAG: sulfotransferase [Xenococcaceae cyanobacterium MO_167.B27]|nr:sulfotransferase [Xenococcaceae cyanobacterium MO_167.B27]